MTAAMNPDSATSSKGRIFIGAVAGSKPPEPRALELKFANRHGLIAGATGTGKTVSLQILAEGFAAAGVPVFMADVKGDLAGISEPGSDKPSLQKRAAEVGLADYSYTGFPTIFWDVFGAAGHPVRATVSEMGPLLLARLLSLNETQEGVLALAFRVADDEKLLVLDLKDLRALLTYIADNAARLTTAYGNVSSATIGTIQRRLLELEQQGAAQFFGEPALALKDFMRTDASGRGYINILAAERLITAPQLYATFLLWLLSELFEQLPEVGDLAQPKLVFFFDEAHLLFTDAPKALVDKVTQVVRLIRSKGVGVYFVTQSPLDVPDAVLGQLGNRLQHALRAFTPRDAKAVKAAAATFRPNPALDTERVISELGVGEALVSTLDPTGVPTVVDRVLVRPPSSRLGAISDDERRRHMAASPVQGLYDQAIDRESAYELLERRAVAAPPAATASASRQGAEAKPRPAARRSDSTAQALTKSVLRSVGSSLGREIVRGILGSLLRR